MSTTMAKLRFINVRFKVGLQRWIVCLLTFLYFRSGMLTGPSIVVAFPFH